MLLLLASSCQQTFSNNFADAGEAGACGEGGLPPAPKACSDTIAALASAKVRCGAVSYDASYDDLLDAAADGSCSNVTGIRDETELCFECLPTLETLPCTDVAADKLPLSCQQQLQRP